LQRFFRAAKGEKIKQSFHHRKCPPQLADTDSHTRGADGRQKRNVMASNTRANNKEGKLASRILRAPAGCFAPACCRVLTVRSVSSAAGTSCLAAGVRETKSVVGRDNCNCNRKRDLAVVRQNSDATMGMGPPRSVTRLRLTAPCRVVDWAANGFEHERVRTREREIETGGWLRRFEFGQSSHAGRRP
jgi:hypothetical protein